MGTREHFLCVWTSNAGVIGRGWGWMHRDVDDHESGSLIYELINPFENWKRMIMKYSWIEWRMDGCSMEAEAGQAGTL